MLTSSPLDAELMSKEIFLWTGQPDVRVIFSTSDLFMVPFSLVWGGFAIFWELGVSGVIHLGKQPGGAPILFQLWGIPFVVIGCYMIFGRFFYAAWLKKRTWFAITNERVIEIQQGFSQKTLSLPIKTLPMIEIQRGSHGRGSLIFSYTGSGRNTGRDFLSASRRGDLAFHDIPDVDQVYDLVRTKQRELRD